MGPNKLLASLPILSPDDHWLVQSPTSTSTLLPNLLAALLAALAFCLLANMPLQQLKNHIACMGKTPMRTVEGRRWYEKNFVARAMWNAIRVAKNARAKNVSDRRDGWRIAEPRMKVGSWDRRKGYLDSLLPLLSSGKKGRTSMMKHKQNTWVMLYRIATSTRRMYSEW